jgi:hypothetical protein
VNIENVMALSGGATDLEKPDYRRLKAQLAAVRTANALCRFVYLMGRRPARRAAPAGEQIFIFVDSESPDSKDYSPPGQVYEEVPDTYRRVFQTGTEAITAPVSDRWGTWISALVPLRDPQTGGLAAVLGMDIDARAWRRAVLAAAA